ANGTILETSLLDRRSPVGLPHRMAIAPEKQSIPPSIWFGFSGLLIGAGVHRFVTYPLSLWLLEKARRRADPSQTFVRTTPSFAICVCAYNEEATIERKVRNMLALRRRIGSLEILVYVDA